MKHCHSFTNCLISRIFNVLFCISGICPFCEYKFSDLLGHIRHGHNKDRPSGSSKCPLCSETFGSVRELVSHRQLHPQFKNHTCSKCSLEFETVVELRQHRAKSCTKSKKGKNKKTIEDSPPKTSTVQANQPSSSLVSNSALNTLMLMANGKLDDTDDKGQNNDTNKIKHIEFEGRGTVACHICKKSFILKTLLRRHYITIHNFDPQKNPSSDETEQVETCKECQVTLPSINEAIKHHLENHATISGQICPYCDCKYGAKKFDNLDSHVTKHHLLDMQSPMQTCSTCKTHFNSYEALKTHRQMHEGGNRPRILVDVISGEELITVHPRVGAKLEISNRGGLKCHLCNAFKLRKDHLKLHYIRHHGYDPKAKEVIEPSELEDEASMQGAPEPQLECPSCHEMFPNNHFLIRHLLKNHCVYSGLICPYCPGHFPARFIDLQSHVTGNHMEQLTGYNICNRCKVCQKQFSGYAELRDHVQLHGDGYKDSISNNMQNKRKKKVEDNRVSDKTENIHDDKETKRSPNAGIRTKVLVPVSTDENGQFRLTSEAIQKAILMVTEGGQVENLPQDGLLLNSGTVPVPELVTPPSVDFDEHLLPGHSSSIWQ